MRFSRTRACARSPSTVRRARTATTSFTCAVVIEGECTQKEILDHCRSRIADYKIPSRVAFMDALPKSDTGKLLRHKLRDA